MSEEKRPYNQLDSMMAWEQGDLDRDGIVELFQDLIDTGMAWQLQGAYGRMATTLIAAGYCHRSAIRRCPVKKMPQVTRTIDIGRVPREAIERFLLNRQPSVAWELSISGFAVTGSQIAIALVEGFCAGWLERNVEVLHLERKNAHKCNDMHCDECDGPREDR